MLICTLEDGKYEGSILLLNKEIEDRSVEDIVKMIITLAKVDIILAEVGTIRTEVKDYAQMYKLLENLEMGNILLNGARWKSRTFVVINEVFTNILQAGKLPENFDLHQKVLDNFIKMNKWTEGQEHIGCGWIESYDKHVRAKVKLTKRNQNFINQRMEIFKTKTELVKHCQEREKTGKI